jgi:ABC-type iron transport system FetAB permease component
MQETRMRRHDVVQLLLIGLTLWILGSIYYAYRGQRVLEGSRLQYWIAFFVSPIVTAVICVAILRMKNVPAPMWASAMLLLAIPGMVGEAVVLSHLSVFMPRIQASSGGRYGAFLFATYALVLSIAEFVTLRAAP